MANIIEIIISATDKASGAINKIHKSFSELDHALDGIKGTGKRAMIEMAYVKEGFEEIQPGIRAAISAIKEFYAAAEEGAQISRLRTASGNLAASMGADMSVIVQSVKAASLGTISEYDAMASASRAMMLGVSADAEQLANLMQVAALRGRAMGLSTQQAFDDIVRGIGRMSPLILDNLGIVIDADMRYAFYAQSIGKSAGALTSMEKRQALLNAVLEEGNEMLEKQGGLTEDSATAFEKNKARVMDAGNALKEYIATMPANWFQKLSKGADDTNRALAEQADYLLRTSRSAEEYNQQLKAWAAQNGIAMPRLAQMGLLVKSTGDLIAAQAAATGNAGDRTRYLATELDNLRGSLDETGTAFANYATNVSTLAVPQLAAAFDNAWSAQMTFQQAQQNYVEGTGNELVQMLMSEFPRGGEAAETALMAVDEVFGTSSLAALQHQQALEKALKEYRRTGDVDKFKTAIAAVKDELPPTIAKLKQTADQLAEVYKWMAMIRGLGALNIKVIADIAYPGGGGGGGVNQHITPAPGSRSGNPSVSYGSPGYNWGSPTTGAEGGQWLIPSGYPNDSALVPFALTSGEMVTVTPRKIGGAPNGNMIFVFNYSPAVALGDRYEAEAILAPMIERAMRKLA